MPAPCTCSIPAKYAIGRSRGFLWIASQVMLQQISCAAVTLMVAHCGECSFETQQANLVELDDTEQHTLR